MLYKLKYAYIEIYIILRNFLLLQETFLLHISLQFAIVCTVYRFYQWMDSYYR